jgi:dienelactone hydrolase
MRSTVFVCVKGLFVLALLVSLWMPLSGSSRDRNTIQKKPLLIERLRIPEKNVETGLETVLVRPVGDGPFPLVVLTHGKQATVAMNKAKRATDMLPVASEFAQRGWATAIVMRRGYGTSGGRFSEDMLSCEYPDYLHAAREGARDLRRAILFLGHRPEIDATHVIAVGGSAGGVAVVALTADPPPGLVAAINFSGIRGYVGPDTICDPEMLVSTFWILGKSSRVPMLWVYSTNDHVAPLALARRCYEEFTRAGGQAEFVEAPPFRTEGHYLFGVAGIPLWRDYVYTFLRAHQFNP